MSSDQIHRIVLTGGPCAGKTTALVKVGDRLEALGYAVYQVPEVATLLATGGVPLLGHGDPLWPLHLQSQLIQLQKTLEDAFLVLAQQGPKPAVILCDRGVMDAKAYVEPEIWEAILSKNKWSEVYLRDQRYEGIVHMVTAAKGAEFAYDNSTNKVRHEPLTTARALDERTSYAWIGHPKLRVIDNSTDFEGKIQRVIQTICAMLGVPEPLEVEKKFLCEWPVGEMPVPFVEFLITQTYLTSEKEGEVARVRKKEHQGQCIYTHTIKRFIRAGVNVEIERKIDPQEFLTLLQMADPARIPIRKLRRCFLWENRYFELDLFYEPASGLAMLEIELDDEGEISEFDDDQGSLALPPFLKVFEEVTQNKRYTNHYLSKGG